VTKIFRIYFLDFYFRICYYITMNNLFLRTYKESASTSWESGIYLSSISRSKMAMSEWTYTASVWGEDWLTRYNFLWTNYFYLPLELNYATVGVILLSYLVLSIREITVVLWFVCVQLLPGLLLIGYRYKKYEHIHAPSTNYGRCTDWKL